MSENYRKYLLSAIILQLIFIHISGQKIKVTRDFRLVSELEVIKSFAEKWELGLSSKCWFEKDVSEFGEINLDATFDYKPLKFLSVGFGYRWSENRNKYGHFTTKHRFSGDLDLVTKIERFRFGYRICFQNIDDDLIQENEDNPARNVLRNRLQLKYNIRNSKLVPFVLAEHYGRLEQNIPYGIKVKSEIGTTYDINKHHRLKLYYRIDRELNSKNPYTFYSLGLGYLFEF